MTQLVESIAEVPRRPGIYAMYGGERVGHGWVAYVGIAGNLRRRLEQHFVRRDSSVVTGTSAVGVNVDRVRYVEWWEHRLLVTENARHAAELIAFDALNPALRSRGSPRAAALELLADPEFRRGVEQLLAKPPAGVLVIMTIQDLAKLIHDLDSRIAALEARLG